MGEAAIGRRIIGATLLREILDTGSFKAFLPHLNFIFLLLLAPIFHLSLLNPRMSKFSRFRNIRNTKSL
jgi:hypothetical protein